MAETLDVNYIRQHGEKNPEAVLDISDGGHVDRWMGIIEEAGFKGAAIDELETFLYVEGRTFGEAADALSFLDRTSPTDDGNFDTGDGDQNGKDGIINTLDANYIFDTDNNINDEKFNAELIERLERIDEDYQETSNIISADSSEGSNTDDNQTSTPNDGRGGEVSEAVPAP